MTTNDSAITCIEITDAVTKSYNDTPMDSFNKKNKM